MVQFPVVKMVSQAYPKKQISFSLEFSRYRLSCSCFIAAALTRTYGLIFIIGGQ